MQFACKCGWFMPAFSQLLERAREAEGEAEVAHFVATVEAELELRLADLLCPCESPCPIVHFLCAVMDFLAVADAFPFEVEVAHEDAHDAVFRCEFGTEVERVVVLAGFHVLGFRGEVVVNLFVNFFIPGTDVRVFTVDAKFRNDFVAEVCGHAVRYCGGVLQWVDCVHAVGELCFERKFELEVFFDADVAGVHLVVAGSEHGAELRNAVLPAEFESVVGVVAHPEAA